MKIGIIGLGLIGGSITKALKCKMDNTYIVAFDSDESSLKQAIADGSINEYTLNVNEKFSECDIIFMCTPINISLNYMKLLSKIVKSDCIITDVSSTKSDIVNLADKIDNINFIGGHPMTGSEKSGYISAKETLFENAFYIVTPTIKTTEFQKNIIKIIIESLGAIYIELTAEEHDKCVSIISHIPHIIASGLVNFVKKQDNENEILKTLSAGGFKDITRIASSNGELWNSIILSNKEFVSKNLTLFIEELENIRNTIDDNDENINLVKYINNGKKYRDSFKDTSSYLKLYDISVDVPDEPNVIGIVATILGKCDINIKNIGINNNRENNDYALKISFHDKMAMENAICVLLKNQYKTKIM